MITVPTYPQLCNIEHSGENQPHTVRINTQHQ